jgi:hypothetical protein
MEVNIRQKLKLDKFFEKLKRASMAGEKKVVVGAYVNYRGYYINWPFGPVGYLLLGLVLTLALTECDCSPNAFPILRRVPRLLPQL